MQESGVWGAVQEVWGWGRERVKEMRVRSRSSRSEDLGCIVDEDGQDGEK